MVGKPLTSGDPTDVGSYRIVSRLGEGGMGVVYLATDENGRRVALKVIRPHLASHDEFLDRFRSEVALARKVARFCTAPILSSDTDADPPYIVTEYVDGPTLTAAVAENGALSGSELHALGVGVASALTAIHRAGIVHRDLKPSNVLLSRYGPRVIDFGIAKAVDAMTSITQTGQFIGSPSYAAPERFRGEPITPRTDIFAWGSVLAFAGTGRAPFGDVAEAVAYRVVHGDPDLEGLDPELTDLVRWTVSKDPADRPTAQELLDALLHHGRADAGLPVVAAAGLAPSSPPTPWTPPAAAEPTTVAVGGSAAEDRPPVLSASLPTARRRHTGRVIAAAAATIVLLAGAASGGVWLQKQRTAADPGPTSSSQSSAPASPSPSPTIAAGTTPAVKYDDSATGPATPIQGAKRHGTVTGLQEAAWRHLDPQRNYEAESMSIGSALLYRSLTGYVSDGSGRLRLVGDLATNTGVSTEDGRTWTYQLRPGLKFQDGTPITAGDVAYGIARSFAPEVDEGPRWIQNWLVGTGAMSADFRKEWAGPYRTGRDAPPGVTVIDKTTLRFTFVKAHPEFPMVAALGTTAPVPKDKDTRGQYDRDVVSSGPYQIASRTAGHLELVRNEHWDPATDPIRHAYPEKWIFRTGLNPTVATKRALAGTAEAATSFTWSNVPPELAPTVRAVAAQRILDEPTPTTEFLAINTQRVTDVNVRKALNAAIDREAAMMAFRGSTHGRPSTTVLSSALPGHREHQALGFGVRGDPAIAKSLLNGRTPRIRYPYSATGASAGAELKLANYVKGALEKVGFTVELVAVPGRGYYDAVGRKDNKFDLYLYRWGPDIPDASGVFGPLFSRHEIGPRANTNTSYLDAPINGDIEDLQWEADRAKAAAEYGSLDEKLLKVHAPVVPLFEQRQFSVRGARLDGLHVHRVFGTVGLENAHVRP